MALFDITKNFDLQDIGGVPSDGSTNTAYTAGSIQGFTDVDENGYPVFSYPVGAFQGNSGWFWDMMQVGVPVPDYGTISNSSGADGTTGIPVVSTNVLGMPPTIGKAVIVLGVLGAAALVYFKFIHKSAKK